ncbi:MAG: radical SAM protein [bacterium]|nr:radical SAM protein [bacterium]
MAGCDKNIKFTCDWLDSILVVLSDGKVVCGCADPNGKRPLGHLEKNTLYEIWNSDKVKKIRRELNEGHSCFCHDCGLKRPLEDNEPVPQHPIHQDVLPRIFLEPTVACNLNCFEAVCNLENGILKTRKRIKFPMEEFKAVIDQVGDKLTRLDFFNYGDPFVHPKAPEMIQYIKEKYPHIYVYISTNGLLLTDDKIKKVVASGMDEITFSVDGPNQETYEKYRRGGNFDKILGIMEKFVQERDKTGREVPFINWRYILFNWNDSKAHMKKAKKLAEKIGVDRFTWEITDHPEAAKSEKYQIGTEYWKEIYHEIWDSGQIGNAIRSKRFIAKMKVLSKPGEVKAGSEPAEVKVKVKNSGGALWQKATTSGRRWVRIGAQLHDQNKNLVDLNYARAFLNRDLANKEKDVLTVSLPPLSEPGDYFLKFDMVSEGNDWFENGGSPVVWEPLRVLRT